MPRKYSMKNRSAEVEETKRKIVDATVQLHNEKGVTATSMQDVADRADVALATVYRHFPTLDVLIPACGDRNRELNPPPTNEAFAHLTDGSTRVAALVEALHAYYSKGARSLEVGYAEALTLTVMAQRIEQLSSMLRGLVAEASAPFAPDESSINVATGLCDFRVWRSLTEAGVSEPETTALITKLVSSACAGQRKGG